VLAAGRLSGFPIFEVCHRMTGTLLPLAGFSEKTMNVVPPRYGQLFFDAPDFLEHQIAPTLGDGFILVVDHIIRLRVLRACRWPAVHDFGPEPTDAAQPRSAHWQCADNSMSAIRRIRLRRIGPVRAENRAWERDLEELLRYS